jgi:RNA polymerase sigma factor (sigma-70 family)
LTENELIEDCIRGNAKSQRKLFQRFAGKMMTICRRYARDHSEAEDMLQDAFIKVFCHIGQYRFEGSLEGWIKRIVVHTALRTLQKNKLRFVNHYSIISTPEKRSSTHSNSSSAADHSAHNGTPTPVFAAHLDQTTSTPAHLDQTISATAPPDQTTLSNRAPPNLTLPFLATLSTRGTIPECPLTPRSRFKPNLDANTGPDFYLSAIGGVGSPALYYHHSYTTGIRLTIQITPHWSATTGLQYSWANFGKGQRYILDSLSIFYPKTFRNLAIPILIGYTFPSEHQSFAVNAGVVLNVYSSTNFNYDFPGQTGPCILSHQQGYLPVRSSLGDRRASWSQIPSLNNPFTTACQPGYLKNKYFIIP